MSPKKISRRYTDIFHLAMFLIILLLFANYEVKRKTTPVEASAPSHSDVPYLTTKAVSKSLTTWK